ncbi:class I SAM-dependent methyltransferase [Arsenicibacter rosenii]|uniref:Methyltransferase domain-containing protein n=1 Tax=Arsenicibacter rosenii TaxID=1750698 RepID=A0A1S2VHE0_9BACT|nr:class I SAM-dependent methyltransferase [Arsenicibacter rosenii]OIN58152.1 hypothetical protein BLX24_16675 [Arsenicibacter rosenii]
MSSILSLIKRKVFRVNRDRWNYQYDKGLWHGLKALDELGRFSVVVGYIKFLKPDQPDILEIGCGEGLLQQRLQQQNYGRFVGLDISDRAIDAARADADPKCTYLVADMDRYTPEGTFDMIVFSESVYYSKHILKTLQRYSQFLKPDGLFLITINQHKHSDTYWTEIMAGVQLVDETVVTTSKGVFDCRVFRPH